MGVTAEIRNKYESLMKTASGLYLDKQFQKALAVYNEALILAKDSSMSKVIISILEYMICCCLFESDKLEDLAEVVVTLQSSIDKSVKNRFPAVYCLLARTHCKLYRFELAETEFRNAEAILKKNPTLESFCIPGTNVPIRPTSKNDETWAKIEEECTAYRPADAICSSAVCNHVTKPYFISNKNIFLKDPAFNGMIIVNCNNRDQPCELKFHQSCWKMQKDELYPIRKVSDKDILGDKCFTPNCLNGDTACVISSIRVIDENGELKAHIKENPAATRPVKPQPQDKTDKDKNTPKGALRKPRATPTPKKPENSTTVVQQQQLDSINQAKNVQNEDGGDSPYYDESQIIVFKDNGKHIDFSREPPKAAGEKSFLFSLFVDYIKKNLVTVSDVYSKFNEYNQDLHLKDMDILGFLLDTEKFELLSEENNTGTSNVDTEDVVSRSNESLKAKNYDDDAASFIDDVYHELMNDRDEVFVDCTENTEPMKNYNFNEQDLNINLPEEYQNQYNFINGFSQDTSAGGDASGHLKNTEFPHMFPQQFNPDTKFDNMPIPFSSSQENEDKHLKDYIIKLESDLEGAINENSTLRKEIHNRDSDIESYKIEQESYLEKIKKCEDLYETMMDFQKSYQNLDKENVEIKEELVQVMKEKNELEVKIEKLEDPETKRSEVMKLLQEELELLEQALNEDWEQKTDTLKKTLKTEIEVKMSLLNKLLNTQHSSMKHVITEHFERCTDVIEVTSKLNAWMERTMCVKNFSDNSEWIKRLDLLQCAANELQSEYSNQLKELHAEKEEKYKMTDIHFKIPEIPQAPNVKLGDIVMNALNAYYRHQYQIMQNYAMKAQQATQAAAQAAAQAMQYQMHSASQSQVYQSVPAGYTPQYPFNSAYTTPNYQWTPRTPTTGPPPNLTLPLATPAPQTPLSNISGASTPVVKVEKEEPKLATAEQSASTRVADVLPKKDEVKEDVKDSKESEVKASGKIDIFGDKIAQMKEAFKTLAMNVKEKSKLEKPMEKSAVETTEKLVHSPVEQKVIEKVPEKTAKAAQEEFKKAIEKVAAPVTKTVNNVKDNVEKATPATKFEINKQAQSVNDTVSIRDDRSDITTCTTRDDSKSQKKVGMDGLVKLLMKKFPGAMECDVIEVIAKIRKERNNALTGIPVRQVIEEAKQHLQHNQRLHGRTF